ncbi:MAG: RimK-like ATPgrasp N-terminal domain-containing protein [Deltaproteobacteria bacterium]|nr:RimK-like ATPgrasp N-terminal domain-containing protein [Deltaproteobacteria bacterium]
MKPNGIILVVSDRRDVPAGPWPVFEADAFLAGGELPSRPGLTVVNLCRSWRYLSKGYYVSLVAEARGQHAVPPVETIEGFNNPFLRFRVLREVGVDVIDRSELTARLRVAGRLLPGSGEEGVVVPAVRERTDDDPVLRAPHPDELHEVLVCLGRAEEPGFRRIAARVFKAWPAPLLRMRLLREEERWKLFDLFPEKPYRLKDAERAALGRALEAPLVRPADRADIRGPCLAVLYEELDAFKASTSETIDKLEKIADRKDLRIERIGLNEVQRLGEFDGLFIRVLTGLDQPAYRFASRAESMGLPVIDDPRSIIRCSNKIFLHELMIRERIPTPRTVIVSRDTTFGALREALGVPYVVKMPDGSFSAAVFKVESEDQHRTRVGELLHRSPLLVAQEYLPTPFDWRVTVLDGKPLFVARYYMAPGHWQICNMTSTGARYGRVEAVPRDHAPREVVRLGCRAARLVGDGLYGVDIKEGPTGPVVIEVNDNPNLDTGYDDAADGDAVYEDIVSWFLKRIPQEPAPAVRPRPRTDPEIEALRMPVGRVPRAPRKDYDAWEVTGLELEYVVVDRDLNAIPRVPEILATLAGRPTSAVEMGLVTCSNEIFEHVLEVKNTVPLRSLVRAEEVLLEGVRRLSVLLAARFDARLLPGGMHPWLDPRTARLWRRSNRRVYETYERLFDIYTHAWANVQAVQLNVSLGSDAEAVAMMNATGLLLPYLPAVAASSPVFAGEIQAAADNRLAFLMSHQGRLPASTGDIVPEPISDLSSYRRDILGRIYEALDVLPDPGAVRHEFLNARGAVFRTSRNALEVRVLDAQECVHMDVAVACFTRLALRSLARDVLAGRRIRPPQEVLVEDFKACVRDGTRALVRAPHLAPHSPRDSQGRLPVRDVLLDLLQRAEARAPAEEELYLDRIRSIAEKGNLSERIVKALEPWVEDDDHFTDAARRLWIELCTCLLENRPWSGRDA